MSVAEVISSALSQFGDPVYAGTKESVTNAPDTGRYYVFNLISSCRLFADDAPEAEVTFATISFFCPLEFDGFEQRRSQTKQALFNAGFTWPSTTDASDADSRHVVFECEFCEFVAGTEEGV